MVRIMATRMLGCSVSHNSTRLIGAVGCRDTARGKLLMVKIGASGVRGTSFGRSMCSFRRRDWKWLVTGPSGCEGSSCRAATWTPLQCSSVAPG